MLRALAYLNNFTIFVPTHFITNYNFITVMKTNYLFLLLLSCFIISCENEEPPISLDKLQGVYTGESRSVLLNGEEYTTDTEGIGIGFNPDYSMPAKEDGKMILELLAIWPPYEKSIIIEMQTVATSSEVMMKGNLSDSPYYQLDAEAIWKEGQVNVNLNYQSTDERVSGKTFILRLDEASLDLSRLYPKQKTVEYMGENINTEEFVKDAFMPIVKVLSRELGNEIKLEMREDGSMEVSVKKEGSNNFTPIPGKHRHWLHGENFGYFVSDYEGAAWLHKILQENEYISIALSGTFLHAARNYTQNAIPILYYFDDGDLIFCNDNEPGGWLFYKFLTLWTDSNRISTTGVYGLTDEEINKINVLSDLIFKNIVRGNIYIRAEKQ